MEKLLGSLEALDEGSMLGILVPILLGLFVPCIYYWFLAKQGPVLSTSKSNTQMTSNTQRNLLLSSVQETSEKWKSRPREYLQVLRQGPDHAGKFSNWFQDEINICREFSYKISALEIKNDERYPTVEINYLGIVGESNARPKPHWVWLIIAVMMVAEAYGLSVLLAGHLSDTGTASEDKKLAIGICTLLSIGLVTLAVKIAKDVSMRRYAWLVWRASNGVIKRQFDKDAESQNKGQFNKEAEPQNDSTKTLGLTEAGNSADQHQMQAIRRANRSEYVYGFKSEGTATPQIKRTLSEYSLKLKLYIGFIILFGVVILTYRIYAINENFGREIERVRLVASADPPAIFSQSGRPKIVDQANDSASQLVTQESLEQTKSTKTVATLFYVLLFWLVQTVAVLLSSRYGFVSDHGEEAYNIIRNFRAVHGPSISEEDYKTKCINNMKLLMIEARALASETLQSWQLGLQTEYRSIDPGLTGEQRRLIEAALNSAASRTYDFYTEIMGPQADIKNPTKASVDAPGIVNEVIPTTNLMPLASIIDVDPKIDYILFSDSQTASPDTARLSELKSKIGEAEIDAASIRLKRSESSDPYASYHDFMKQLKSGRV